MKIIVLAGGLSTERDVSLASAAGICNTLLEKGHDAFLLDVFLGLENAPENLEDVFTLPGHGLEIAKNISETEPDLAAVKASRPDQSDCFFRYTGPDSLGCAVAMDKGLTKQIFMEAGVDTPSGVCLYKEDSDCSLESLGLSFPVVVKPCSGGSSIGVYIVNTEDEYRQALKNSFRYENEVVVETYIKVRAFQALKLNVYSRADFILDADGNLYCLEMNTLPGMTSASLLPKEALADGIEYGDLCELIIQKSMEARYQ